MFVADTPNVEDAETQYVSVAEAQFVFLKQRDTMCFCNIYRAPLCDAGLDYSNVLHHMGSGQHKEAHETTGTNILRAPTTIRTRIMLITVATVMITEVCYAN